MRKSWISGCSVVSAIDVARAGRRFGSKCSGSKWNQQNYICKQMIETNYENHINLIAVATSKERAMRLCHDWNIRMANDFERIYNAWPIKGESYLKSAPWYSMCFTLLHWVLPTPPSAHPFLPRFVAQARAFDMKNSVNISHLNEHNLIAFL